MNNYPDLSSTNYSIIRELGRNSEGGRVSYLATENDRQVVIKQFRFFTGESDWHGFKVYETEVNILKELNHPRIPTYIDSFETDDGFCLVQEYKDAPSIATLKDLTPQIVQKIAISILEILEDLQSRKPAIIHRDLKPENILVDTDYNAYLIDFGLAKKPDQNIAISSMAMGTPGFMPPEEVFSRSVTSASDLYSLGATLIGLLTNTPSIEISSLINDNYRFYFQDQLGEINPLFVNWLTLMVEPNPKNRFPNATTALKAIKSIDIDNYDRYDSSVSNKPNSLLIGSRIVIGLVVSANIWGNYIAPSSSPKVTTQNRSFNQKVHLAPDSAQQWFKTIKPQCNSVEIGTTIGNFPPPQTTGGIGYASACYALAGKIEVADQLIQSLPQTQQAKAANIVFNIGHPIADAGDDESAGAIMNLVVKYQPNNYMALYHAGMSAYILGDLTMSKQHLESFLDIYSCNNRWRQNALEILDRI